MLLATEKEFSKHSVPVHGKHTDDSWWWPGFSEIPANSELRVWQTAAMSQNPLPACFLCGLLKNNIFLHLKKMWDAREYYFMTCENHMRFNF